MFYGRIKPLNYNKFMKILIFLSTGSAELLYMYLFNNDGIILIIAIFMFKTELVCSHKNWTYKLWPVYYIDRNYQLLLKSYIPHRLEY